MIIYVDVLLAVNFAVNFVLLRITALICRKRLSALRAGLGGAVGALGAMVLFLPPMTFVLQMIYRIALTLAVCAAAFCPCGVTGYIKAVITLMLSSMLLTGALTLWQMTFSPMGFAQKGGAVYLDIGAFALIVCCGAGYIAASFFSWAMTRVPIRQFCTVSVLNNGGSATFSVLIDTGNSLREPFSALPVIVCDKRAIKGVLPDMKSVGIRLIPYKTVGDSGMLPAFLPEKVILQKQNGEKLTVKCYIAVSKQEFGGEYSGVCDPVLFSDKSCSGGEDSAAKTGRSYS